MTKAGIPLEVKAREYLAGQAINGILASADWAWDKKLDENGRKKRLTETELAAKAVRIADYILAEMKRRPRP